MGPSTGEEALAALKNGEPAVALLDLNLPDLSGLEVMRRLKAICPDTEVILFTGLGAWTARWPPCAWGPTTTW